VAQPAGSPERYVQLVELYASGAHREARRELGSWAPGDVSDAAEALLGKWQASEGEDVRFTGLAQAAVLLHTELSLVTAERGDPVEHGRQVLTIRRLLRALRGRERAGAATGILGAIPARDLYLATAAVQLAVGAAAPASTLLLEYFATGMGRSIALRDEFALAEYRPEDLGLTGAVQVDALITRFARDADDAPMLLLAGCTQETLAMLIRQSSLEKRDSRTRDALRRAETFFRAALRMDPEGAEVQLRLGWLLVQRGELRSARPLLESVARSAPSTKQSYLAWLFLGRLLERAEEPAQALAAFERAAFLLRGAEAARLTIAQLREKGEGYEAASQVLQPYLGAAGPAGPGPEPWTLYLSGPEDMRLKPLEQLRARLR